MVLEKQRQSFLGGGSQTSREYSERMAEKMDTFIKDSLEEHYKDVIARLEEYKDAIENMVELLYEKENITGKQVRDIIHEFEEANNMESKLQALSVNDKKHEEDNDKREE
jgi:cell division protease FtsH